MDGLSGSDRLTSTYGPKHVTDDDVREFTTTAEMFTAAEKKYAARLRRAKLTAQVRIFGFGGVGDTLVSVKLLCCIPEVDRVAISAMFDELHVEWFAKLPNGLTRAVDGWDPSTQSWQLAEAAPS